nr:calcium-binding mitochondrial carrier sal1 [Quercus suber]
MDGESEEEQEARLQALWHKLDTKKKGTLDLNALKTGLAKINHPLRDADDLVRDMLAACDIDHDGKISHDDFARFCKRTETELWMLFKSIDKDRSGNLDKKELSAALERANLKVSNTRLDRFFSSIDQNRDGRIDFTEWRDFLLFIPTNASGLKAVFSYYDASVKVTSEGDVNLNDEALAGFGTISFLKTSLFGAIFALVRHPQTSPKTQTSSASVGDSLRSEEVRGEAKSTSIPHPSFLEEDMPSQEPHLPVKPERRKDKDQLKLTDLVPDVGYFIAGGVSGITSRTATAPLDRLKVYLIAQTGTGENAAHAVKQGAPIQATKHGMAALYQACQELWAAGGIRSLFAGNGLNVIKVMPESAVKFGSYEAAKRAVARFEGHNDPKRISGSSQFIAGGVAGMISQAVVYPLDTLKFRMQCETVPGGEKGNKLILHTIQKMWAKNGIVSFYRGLPMGLIGMFPYAAIDLFTFETLKRKLVAKNMKKLGVEHEEDALPNNFTLAIMGGCSGAFGASVVYPLNLLRTRLQSQDIEGRRSSWAVQRSHAKPPEGRPCCFNNLRRVREYEEGAAPPLTDQTLYVEVSVKMVQIVEILDDDEAKKKMLETQRRFAMSHFSKNNADPHTEVPATKVMEGHPLGDTPNASDEIIATNGASELAKDTIDTHESPIHTADAARVEVAAAETNDPHGSTDSISGPGSPTTDYLSLKPSATEQDHESLKFESFKASIARKKAAGTLSVAEEIAFLRAETEERSRRQRIVADRELERTPTPAAQTEDDEDALFVGQPQKFSDLFSDVEDAPAPKKRGRKRKNDGDASGPARKRGSKKTRAKSTSHDDAASTADNVPTKKSKKATSKRKAKIDETDGGMTNLSNIMSSNVFDDVALNENLGPQPLHNSTRKVEAMKQLIASIPDKAVGMTDVRWLRRATQDFVAHSIMPASDGLWYVKGLRTTLKHFQVIGSGFIIKREKVTAGPKGGILADQMGLGKTLMILTTIVNNALDHASKKPRATLVVASQALINQWDEEIKKHCLPRKPHEKWGVGNVLHYHAGSRIQSNNVVELLEQADIVLTTYHEVSRSYPKVVIPVSLSTPASKNEYWDKHYAANKGVLHRCNFYRVVLDEAHAIKNHRSHTSQACRGLEAKFRWAVTGTPVQNNIAEFYPYFKFLRDPHVTTHQAWKENFPAGGANSVGSRRISVLLSRVMMRRTHIDTLFNARLLDLPTPKQNTVWLDFNNVERQIYQIVKQRFVSRINAISSKGQFEKRYGHIWTMLLRLRQICGHVLLVQESLMDLLEREDYEKLSELAESEDEFNGEQAEILVHLRRILAQNVDAKRVDATGPESGFITTETETVPIDLANSNFDYSTEEIGGAHGLKYPFKKYLEAMRHDAEGFASIIARSPCCACYKPPQDPYVTSCSHIYCYDCLEQLAHRAARNGYDCSRCEKCGEQYNETRPCTTAGSTPALNQPTNLPSAGAKKRAKKTDPTDDWINMG